MRLINKLERIRRFWVRCYYWLLVRARLRAEHHACVLCGNDEWTLVSDQNRNGYPFTIQKCVSCGMILQQPFPTKEFLDRFYIKDYYRGLYWGSHKAHPDDVKKRHSLALERLKLLNHMLPLVSGVRILDFGSGVGAFIDECHEQYPAVAITGMDPGTHIAPASGGDGFSAITLMHVLEHIPDPVQTLEGLAPLLVPGGYIYIEVPDIEARHTVREFHIAHVLYFTSATLRLCLETAGYTVIREEKHADRSAISIFAVPGT